MFCKIFYFNNDSNFNKILSVLNDIEFPYRIMTDNTSLNEFLKKNKKNSNTFDEVFLEDKITHDVYQKTYENLSKINHLYENLVYKDCKIFESLETLLREEIALVEKSRIILQSKTNTVFIFKGVMFSYFVINKIAKDLGYDIEDDFKIFRIKGKNVELSNSREINYGKNIKRNLLLLKKAGIRGRNNPENILKKVHKKIINSDSKYDASCMFFLTPSSDYVLEPILSIIQKFKQTKTLFQIIVFDSHLSSQLSNDNIQHVNLFEEAYALSIIVEKSIEGKQLYENITKITQENGLSILGIDRFFNPLLKKIFFSAAIILIGNYIFNNGKPKSIVTANDGTITGNAIISVSKKRKITSYSIRTHLVSPHPGFRSTLKADKICIYGNHGLETLVNLGFKKERIVLTGNVRYDYIKLANKETQRKFLQENWNIDKNRKLIVVGMGRWYDDDENWISKLIKFCNKKNFEVIIKVHPIYKYRETDIHELKIKKIQKSCKNLKYLITYDIVPSALLPAADLVITDHTNLGLEAALLKKPWITVNFINEDSDFLHEVFDYSGSIFLNKYDELENTIVEILEQEKYLEFFKSRQQKIIDDYNFKNDGNAINRIFDLLNK